ncbi:MAG: hypothetical protein J5940_02645 [Clostridia bacterium]|nr:hypothetical protein [Clostridia bacterium]
MNGLEKIIEGIEAEAAAKKAALQSAFDAEKAAAEAECSKAVGEINAAFKAKSDDAVAAVAARGATQKERRARDIRLAAKSKLVERAFSDAAEKFGEAEDYPETLSSLLIKALDDAERNVKVSDKYFIRMRKCDEKYLDGMLAAAKAAKGNVPSVEPGDPIDEAGFILTDNEVEINCTAASLISEKRTALTPKAAAILFGSGD